MAAQIGGANHSTVSVDKSGMTIRLPSQVFGKGWLLLLAREPVHNGQTYVFSFPAKDYD